jgi:hypothetical protein
MSLVRGTCRAGCRRHGFAGIQPVLRRLPDGKHTHLRQLRHGRAGIPVEA